MADVPPGRLQRPSVDRKRVATRHEMTSRLSEGPRPTVQSRGRPRRARHPLSSPPTHGTTSTSTCRCRQMLVATDVPRRADGQRCRGLRCGARTGPRQPWSRAFSSLLLPTGTSSRSLLGAPTGATEAAVPRLDALSDPSRTATPRKMGWAWVSFPIRTSAFLGSDRKGGWTSWWRGHSHHAQAPTQ